MAHFAEVKNGVVTKVIVAEQQFINRLPNSKDWIKVANGKFAGIGYTHNLGANVFIPPKPYPSWTLNETTWTWAPPTAYPTDGKYYQWKDASTEWVEVPLS
jgi:hypothetical protein